MHKKLGFILAFLLFNFSHQSSAAELQGLVFPEQLDIAKKPLVLNGLGLRQMTIFQVNVYVAALYLSKRSSNSEEILKSKQIKHLDIVFMRDVEAKDIVHSWDEGYLKNCDSNCDAFRPQLKNLDAQMDNVKKGQKVSFSFFPGKFSLSTPGKESVDFEGETFGSLILSTFIGKRPPSEDLRKGLLGLMNWIPNDRELASQPD